MHPLVHLPGCRLDNFSSDIHNILSQIYVHCQAQLPGISLIIYRCNRKLLSTVLRCPSSATAVTWSRYWPEGTSAPVWLRVFHRTVCWPAGWLWPARLAGPVPCSGSGGSFSVIMGRLLRPKPEALAGAEEAGHQLPRPDWGTAQWQNSKNNATHKSRHTNAVRRTRPCCNALTP